MLSLDQFNFFWVPSSLGCCFIFFITWITGTIPHFYSLLPSWSLSLSLLYIYYIWYLGKCDALSWWWRRQNIYLRSEETSYFVSVTHKGKKKKRKRNEFEIKDDVDLYSYWPIYRFLFLYLSERDSIFLSQYIIGLDFFSFSPDPPVLIRVVFLSDRDSHRRPNGVVPSVMSVLYVSCRSISPSQQSFLLSHTHDVCLLLSSSQLFREYRPSRRASCVWNMETRTSGARRDFSSFSAPFMRVAKRLPFFPIFLLPLSFLELIILVSGYVSSLTEKTAGRWKRDRTNNSETSLQTAFTFFLCVCCSSFSLWRERIVALEDK